MSAATMPSSSTTMIFVVCIISWIECFVRAKSDLELRPLLACQRELVVGGGRLQIEQAANDLQVVFDSMMDFFEHDLLFLERGVDSLLGLLALSDVTHEAGEDGRILQTHARDGQLDGKLAAVRAHGRHFHAPAQ